MNFLRAARRSRLKPSDAKCSRSYKIICSVQRRRFGELAACGMRANCSGPRNQRCRFVWFALKQIYRSQILEDYCNPRVIRWELLLADCECPFQRNLSFCELLLVTLREADTVQIGGDLQTLWPESLFMYGKRPFA